MLEVLNVTQQIIVLITGLVGLITAGISAFYAIKNWMKAHKGKSAFEIWNLIMTIADEAMKEAEKSQLKGLDKKNTVINVVKSGCEAAGVKIDDFIDQLDKYIDQTIGFVNDMNGKKKK